MGMIKFLDLQKINARYGEELKKVAAEVIDSGWYLLGERVNTFEKELAAYTGFPPMPLPAPTDWMHSGLF